MKRIALAALLLAGCTTPAQFTKAPLQAYDKHTRYAVESIPSGFILTIEYARYQFIPEASANEQACKQALTSLAWELAEKQGRKIDPINEQRIRLSLGRNGLSGSSLCSATAPVRFL
jgi:hypothetical protein